MTLELKDGDGNALSIEQWAEHVGRGLELTRDAMLGDLSGENGKAFADSTERLIEACVNVFHRSIGSDSLRLHSVLAEMHVTCAEAWKDKVPHESDFIKHGQAVAIHAVPCLAFLATMLCPSYELRLVKVEQPAEQPTEEPAAASA